MSADQRSTAVAVYPDRIHAEYAVEELLRNGFSSEQIGMIVPDAPAGIEPPPVEPDTRSGEGAATGAAVGLAVGGLLGVALSSLILPGVGPVIAGGLLATGLGGAVAGAATGGLVGALVGANIPEEDARHYEREFHSGRSLVTVRANDRYNEAVTTLQKAQEMPESRTRVGHQGRFAGATGEGTDYPGAGSAVIPPE